MNTVEQVTKAIKAVDDYVVIALYAVQNVR